MIDAMQVRWPQPARAVYMSAGLLQSLMTEGNGMAPVDCVEGLPKDAQLLTALYDPKRGAIKFLFVHSSWEPVTDPAHVPIQRVSFRQQKESIPAA